MTLEAEANAAKNRLLDQYQRVLRASVDRVSDSPEHVREVMLQAYPRINAATTRAADTIAGKYFQAAILEAKTHGVKAWNGRGAGSVVTHGDTVLDARSQVRYHARHLFGEDYSVGLSLFKQGLSQSLSKSAGDALRGGVFQRARDAGVEYVWVPQGVHTCAWCTLHASRPPQPARKHGPPKSHDSCDCMIRPIWLGNAFKYDATRERAYQIYREAYLSTPELGRPQTVKETLAAMRRLGNVTDRIPG